ncbi:hypothetical protein JCM10049v2_000223 [Rhodotorula toruloides]
MPRRAKKVAQAAIAASGHDVDMQPAANDAPFEPAAEVDAPAPPPAKKPKNRSALSKVKGRKGAMAVFNALPIDLIFDIASHLDPCDLYVLSRTCKVFRSVVTGTNSQALWQEARARVGLPELALPMTDLQYAHLLFGKGCTFCDRKNAGKPEPYFRARICTACMKDKFSDTYTTAGYTAVRKAAGEDLHPIAMFCTVGTSHISRYGTQYRLADITRVNADLKRRFPISSESYADRNWIAGRRDAQMYGREYASEPSTLAQKWYAEEMEAKVIARREDGDKLRAWLNSQERAKALSKDEIRKIRREDLERRFKAQGFTDSEFNYEWRQEALVKKPELLTERMWAKNEPILKAKLLDIRRRHRRAAFSSCLAGAKLNRPFKPVYPDIDMAVKFPVLAAVSDDLEDPKPAQELFAEHKEAILSDIDGVIRDRLHGMLRAVGKAYEQLRQDQKNKATWKDDYIKNLTVNAVTLPRLPPWIPRDDTTPITASDEQIVAFLESHDLACFTCEKCHTVAEGLSTVQHLTKPYACTSDYTVAGGRVLPTLDDWARCGRPTDPIQTDKKLLLRALYIKKQLDSAKLESPDSSLLEEAAKYNVDMEENKIYKVEVICECEPTRAWYNGARQTKVMDMLNHFRKHINQDTGKITKSTIRVEVDYSHAFRRAVSSARILAGVPAAGLADPFDSLDIFGGYDSGVDYDSYGGYEDEEREECSIM